MVTEFSGTLKSVTRSGLIVTRDDGTFMANGQATEPISRVEAFQPVNLKLVKKRFAQQFTPGVHNAPRAGKNTAVAKVRVVGAVMGLTETGIMVQADKVPVQATLAGDAKLTLNINNFSLAQKGDAAKVPGFYQPSKETLVKADSILINSARIYGEVDESKPKRKTRAEKAAKTEAATAE